MTVGTEIAPGIHATAQTWRASSPRQCRSASDHSSYQGRVVRAGRGPQKAPCPFYGPDGHAWPGASNGVGGVVVVGGERLEVTRELLAPLC